MVPNIPVGQNITDPFHLISNRNYRNFWAEWQAPAGWGSGSWFSILIYAIISGHPGGGRGGWPMGHTRAWRGICSHLLQIFSPRKGVALNLRFKKNTSYAGYAYSRQVHFICLIFTKLLYYNPCNMEVPWSYIYVLRWPLHSNSFSYCTLLL